MLLTSTLSLTYHRKMTRSQTLTLSARPIKTINSPGVISALRSLIKSARITQTAVCVVTHGQKRIQKSGSRRKLPADVKLTQRHLQLISLIGAISAIMSLIKTVARTPIVASADGVGPIMTVRGTDQRTLSAAAKSKSDSSKIMNLSGETIAKT